MFDSVALPYSVADPYSHQLPSSYNGFLATSALPGNNNQTITVRDYASAALGTNYYPTSGTGLYKMIGAGSHSASAAGLYHYTVKFDQTKEGTDSTISAVSIGYHYVALDGTSQPVDTDGDTLADYAEDRNGNGLVDAGETSFLDSDTDGDGLPDGYEVLVTHTDPLNADTGNTGVSDGYKEDPENDGWTNLQEWQNQFNPSVW